MFICRFKNHHFFLFLLYLSSICLIYTFKAEAKLPSAIRQDWGSDKANLYETPTRGRIYLNGLWLWQPVKDQQESVPERGWGYFKVPGSWPGITNYLLKDSQVVQFHSDWKDVEFGKIKSAWYRRDVYIPDEWTGRQILLNAEYINSYTVVYVDGKLVGKIWFPGGEVDLTPVCSPGGKFVIDMMVSALPLKDVMISYNDTVSAREVKGTVVRRGLCGDVYLSSVPKTARISSMRVETSVRKGEVTFEAKLERLVDESQKYTILARIIQGGKPVSDFASHSFTKNDLRNGRFAFTNTWNTDQLWDIHTPQNIFEAQLSLFDAGGRLLDSAEGLRFGFREFWITERDFYLNGSRIFLSAVPLDNAQAGVAFATYEAAKESLLRLKSFGINCVYTHNYGCEPGSHLSYTEILRAADDVGMLVSFSQPHFGHYEWLAPDAEQGNGYARHAEFYVRAAQNHPSVVMYSMSHNATGYSEDMNPGRIDGIGDPRDEKALKIARLAMRAEAIVKALDPSRIVYHHSSGNLGAMHTMNFYPNFAPIQELSDWFEHWAAQGVKPVFTCEYGAPFPWDWTMYRGWHHGKRAFGAAKVPWEFCLAEWNSQFLGDSAFPISEMERVNLRWEARQFQAGNRWHRWDYPYPVDSKDFDERFPIYAMYLTDNWRAFRTWGVSANSPWIYGHFWRLRDGVDKGRREFAVDWEDLQRPGFSPDFVEERYERMDMAFERSDWVPTAAAQALIRNNRPLLAYIGGKPARFTSKDHNYLVGESFEKQIILINNSRETVTADCEWSLELPQPLNGSGSVRLKTGEQERIPLRFGLPASLPAGPYRLNMKARFSNGDTQDDSLTVHVLAPPPALEPMARIALFDPMGETGRLLDSVGTRYRPVKANAELSGVDILIIGKGALTVSGAGPDIRRVRDGLKVIVFEQAAEVLEKRLGFRATEYGLRQVFRRIAGHPLLEGLDAEHLRDWRGAATILPSRLEYEPSRRFQGAPSVRWCDLEVTRVWRCGNRGNVASILIEKPPKGDFLPIADGGFSLQYSPLLEYREGQGLVLFCQMDVTGRSEGDPAAERLVRNIIRHASSWKPRPARKAIYAGHAAGKAHLESLGIRLPEGEDGPLTPQHTLIVGPGGAQLAAKQAGDIGAWLKSGGRLMAIGLDESEANELLPGAVRMEKAEYLSSFIGLHELGSFFAGIGPADLHIREPRILDMIAESGNADTLANGVFAQMGDANTVFCQLAPWQFKQQQPNTKRSYRRVSFMVSRLLCNMGVSGSPALLRRFAEPPASPWEKRWQDGLYLDAPEEWDDPYRFFRW